MDALGKYISHVLQLKYSRNYFCENTLLYFSAGSNRNNNYNNIIKLSAKPGWYVGISLSQ